MTNTVIALREQLLDWRFIAIERTFGSPDEWSDVEAILLCPLPWLSRAWSGAGYLVAQGRHATNMVEGLGRAIRLMHREY